MKKMVVIGMVLCVLTVLVGSASAASFSFGTTGGQASASGCGLSGAEVTSSGLTAAGDLAGIVGGNHFVVVGVGDASGTSVDTTSVAQGEFSYASAGSGVVAGSMH